MSADTASKAVPQADTVERFHGLQRGDSLELLMHLHRYQVALSFAAGRRVLDFGTGDGYGARLLASAAREVLAVDRDASEMKAAALRYPAENLRFSPSDVAGLSGLGAASFDLIVCFEVIEHLVDADQELLAGELARLLAPGGVLLLSTPNDPVKRQQYAKYPNWRNPYHVRELTRDELSALLGRHFHSVQILPQYVEMASLFGIPGSVPVAFSPDLAWVNLAIAGHQAPPAPSAVPFACLPERTRLLEELYFSERTYALEGHRLRGELDAARERVAQLEREAADAGRLNGVQAGLPQEVAEAFSGLVFRAARSLDRFPSVKRAVRSVGKTLLGR